MSDFMEDGFDVLCPLGVLPFLFFLVVTTADGCFFAFEGVIDFRPIFFSETNTGGFRFHRLISSPQNFIPFKHFMMGMETNTGGFRFHAYIIAYSCRMSSNNLQALVVTQGVPITGLWAAPWNAAGAWADRRLAGGRR